jgi:hypothetical protein
MNIFKGLGIKHLINHKKRFPWWDYKHAPWGFHQIGDEAF